MKSLRLFNLLFKTPLKSCLASQLAYPRGWLGRWATSVMNQANDALGLWTLQALDLSGSEHVLEVGFGGGPLLQVLLERAKRVEGVDRSRDSVVAAMARFPEALRRGRLFLGEGDLMDLPMAANSFDAVLSVNTVYFWPDPARCASELFRVLKPGGRLALGLRPGALIRTEGLEKHGFRPWDRFEELTALLAGAGFVALFVDEDKIRGVPSWRVRGMKPRAWEKEQEHGLR
jgi:SAM-dependent methyltransferase